MSVRQDERTKRNGTVYLRWTADVCYRKPDGTELRARRDPRRDTKAAAEKLEREIIKQMEDGTWGKPPPETVPTLAEFEKRFIENYAQKNNKASVIAEKKRVFKLHLAPHPIGKLRLGEITSEVIEDWKAKQVGKPKSINNRLAVLSRVLHIAHEWKLIDTVPIIRTVENPNADFDFLELGEIDRLVKHCERPRLRAMVIGIINGGYRNGEIRTLQWADIDLERNTSMVRRNDWQGVLDTPKHGQSRHVPINATWREALLEWKHRRSLWVFDGDDANGYMTDREEITPLKTACRRAGLREISWHVLRHTFASHLVMAGESLFTVGQLLGHTDEKTTRRYAHLAPRHTAKAVEALAQRQLGVNQQEGRPETCVR